MLNFEKSLVYERLALPRVNILPDQSVTDQLKHLADWNRNVVPVLALDDQCKRVLFDVMMNVLVIIILFVKLCACVASD